MHQYFIKIPWFVKKFFSSYTWNIPNNEKALYLTFDDGPHPTITPWVLDVLAKYGASATFFCIGKNVEMQPKIFERILAENHSVGNHTFQHLNGWKSSTREYVEDVARAMEYVASDLFRPPYGRIKREQARQIKSILGQHSKIIMWDVLSVDFDLSISGEECLSNVVNNVRTGSIVVFHDSEKAFKNLKYALPRCLEDLKSKGYVLKKMG